MSEEQLQQQEEQPKKKRVIRKTTKKSANKNVEYIRDKNGMIDWQAMIPEKFIVVNTGWFEDKKREAPKSIEGLNNFQKLVLIGGIKYIAQLRGIEDLDAEVCSCDEHYTCVKYKINWVDNGEDLKTSVGIAATHAYNVDSGIGRRYLVEFAENRAFCRAVRNGLRIDICSKEEISKNKNIPTKKTEPESNQNIDEEFPSIQENLRKKIEQTKEVTFEKIKNAYLEAGNKEAENWKSEQDVPDPLCFTIIGQINKKYGKD